MKTNDNGTWIRVSQPSGPDLGYSPSSGVKIVEEDGKLFKVHGDRLLPYEDWRLSPDDRAADLASRMTIEQIAGLMLYSPQNRLPMKADTYGGVSFEQSGCKAWDISDGQRNFLIGDKVRHVLVSVVESAEAAARWNNNVQALVEGLEWGIPANNSSDPRHSAFSDAEFSPGASGQLSLWSNLMGFASAMDLDLMAEFGEIASKEYRLLGLATALSPQADLGTDPRWYRYNATFGADPQLVTDLVKRYCETFQAGNEENGWGTGSVNTMVKHWPGGGTGEGGRDAHYGNGKFAVYPSGNFEIHKKPFLEGAFHLDNPTRSASAVMPYYTVSYGQTDENVGNSFNKDLISRQLRGDAGYDGVVCTDWIITADPVDPGTHFSKPWGVESLTVAERHLKALEAGVDQFGGNQEKQPIIDAFHLGAAKYGEDVMLRRFQLSAKRLLLNIFRTGLFENPYVDVQQTIKLVGNPEWMRRGYIQQLKSVVMLKNSGVLPLRKGVRIYVPERHLSELINYWGFTEPARDYLPVSREIGEKYFTFVSSPQEADAAIVVIDSPKSKGMGYDREAAARGENPYIPISLQYRPYTATTARSQSIATDPFDGNLNRSYLGKTAEIWNLSDLEMLEHTRIAMGNKPVITIMNMNNPTVMSEVEPLSSAILVGFSVQTQAFLDLIFGDAEPSGLLPFPLPASMDAVERHPEDMPGGMEVYTDSDGNSYSFGFGLSFRGPIEDERTRRYCR